MKNLTDVQSTAFMAIGPSRIAALSLLALVQDQNQDTQDSGSSKAVLELSVQRISAAYAMLSSGLEELLGACSYSLPQELDVKRKACVEVLAPLHRAVSQPGAAALENLHSIPRFAELCLYRLEPVVSGFLKEMVQTLRNEQQERDSAREQGMKDTIANAEGVGRSIKFISYNASIEAARIGDMGKGFAVIATEIRALSGKTQTLLEEISGYLKR